MNANLVLALLSKHPHLMYIELAVVTPISPSIANLSYIPKAASLPFSYLVIPRDQFVKLLSELGLSHQMLNKLYGQYWYCRSSHSRL
ncbi:Bgt-51593 [Blumeria graminis f. sp. tritici]|uniref:Bgt-51593 n=2 Tax=Blumeria graminis f. sp. tritici TaxID=62690 RepID=A0A9X9QFV0_BLUGR|nr:Bgt-51593 [Blumeria graminis f. sp. tritici]